MLDFLIGCFSLYLIISFLKDSKPDKYEGKPQRGEPRNKYIAWNILHPDDPVEVPDEDDD